MPQHVMTPPALAFVHGAARYAQLDPTGRGAYGTVYLAVDRLTGNAVAIKRQRIPSDAAAREMSIYRLLRAFPHEHVQSMSDSYVTTNTASGGRAREELCMVFTFCPTTLWCLWVSPQGQAGLLGEPRVAGLLHGIACGVDHLHGLQLTHGDLTLKNVLVDEESRAKVCDFGASFCSRMATCSCQDEITTCYVRAPEVWLGGATRHAADIWAVGVIGLALFSGKIPWLANDGAGEFAVIRDVARVIGVPSADVWPDVTGCFLNGARVLPGSHHSCQLGRRS